MNITQYRAKLKTFWDVDFVVWKEKCHIVYKWSILMTCDRSKNDQYSFSWDAWIMLVKEMKYRDKLWDFWKIVSIIRFPILSYKRYCKWYDLI